MFVFKYFISVLKYFMILNIFYISGENTKWITEKGGTSQLEKILISLALIYLISFISEMKNQK